MEIKLEQIKAQLLELDELTSGKPKSNSIEDRFEAIMGHYDHERIERIKTEIETQLPDWHVERHSGRHMLVPDQDEKVLPKWAGKQPIQPVQ